MQRFMAGAVDRRTAAKIIRRAAATFVVVVVVAACGSSGGDSATSDTRSSSSTTAGSASEWSRDALVTALKSVVTEDDDLKDCERQQSRSMCAELNSVEISQLATHADEIDTQLDDLDREVADRSSTLQRLEAEMRSALAQLTESVGAVGPACRGAYGSSACSAALETFHTDLAGAKGTIVDLRSEVENAAFSHG